MVLSSSQEVEGLDLPILHAVKRSASGRKLAVALGVLIAALPAALAFVPWQQNISGAGRVVALDPTKRLLEIPAPIAGRLVKLHVQEGARVTEGQVLAEMEDQDPQYFLRLQQLLELAHDQVEQAHQSLEFYQSKVNNLRREKDSATRKAKADLQIAVEKIEQARAEARQKENDINIKKRPEFERQVELKSQGNTSDKDYQSAEAELAVAREELTAARAKIDEAISEEKSQAAAIDEIDAKFSGLIASAEADVRKSTQELRKAEADLTGKQSSVSRQETQTIAAPMDGTVLSINIANSQGYISRESTLMEFIPDADELVVELLLRGVDAPLVEEGRKARLLFEGWPAVQSPGWPSTAIGTFGGIVRLVDAQARPDGTVRALIAPDPEDDAWPKQPFLRQGVRTTGWIQLETVSAGYELWRQLNAFPPTVALDGQAQPGSKGGGKKSKTSGKGDSK